MGIHCLDINGLSTSINNRSTSMKPSTTSTKPTTTSIKPATNSTTSTKPTTTSTKPTTTSTKPTTPSTTGTNRCTPGKMVKGWVCYGSGWYKFFNIRCSQSDAVRYCRKKKAVLASIHSKYENDLVVKLLGCTEKAWIGGKRQNGSTFYWPYSKRSHMSFQNFDAGEPNNFPPDKPEDCLDIYDNGSKYPGKWNDENCGNHRNGLGGFVCETQ